MRSICVSLFLLASSSMAAVFQRNIEDMAPMVDIRDILPTSAIGPAANDPAPTLSPYLSPPTGPSAPMEVYGGILTCQAASIEESNPQFYMTRNEAAAAISTFCNQIEPGVVFKSDGGTPFQYARADGPYAYPMALSAMWMGGSDSSCPTMDFSNRTSVSVCEHNLLAVTIDTCNTAQNGLQFWKGGGEFLSGCIAWGIQRAAGVTPSSYRKRM